MFCDFVRTICGNQPALCEAILAGYAICEAVSSEPLTYERAIQMMKDAANRDGYQRGYVDQTPEYAEFHGAMIGTPTWRIVPSDSGVYFTSGDDDGMEITTVGEWQRMLNDYISFAARSPSTSFYENPIPLSNLENFDMSQFS